MGDLSQAEAYIRRNTALVQEARGSPHPGWRQSYAVYGRSWEADADEGKALIFEARGQLKEAEAAYVRGRGVPQGVGRGSPEVRPSGAGRADPERGRAQSCFIGAGQGKQNRLSEGEADMRRALLEVLKLRANTIR